MEFSEQVEIIINKENAPSHFAKQSLFYFKRFYQINIVNEFSLHYETNNSYYFYYINSGSIFISLDTQVFTLKRGDLLVIKKGIPVKFFASEANLYIIEFDGKIAKDYIDEIIDENHSGTSIIDFNNIVMFFIRLKELTYYDTYNEVYISLNLEAILVEIYTRKYYIHSDNPPKNDAILKALFYIEKNIAKKINIEDLCEYVGYSLFHFTRLFKKEVGMAPYEYITKFRLDLAKHLLMTTSESIKEIARQCGYGNEINFFIIFKKYENMTPNQYREKQKEEIK